MALSLLVAEELHADSIATIHMAAFGANALLQAQFPTPAIRDELKQCIAEKAVKDIRDPKTTVVIVQDQGEIISFAKWHLPVFESEAYVEPPWRWPEGTNLALLEEWGEKVEVAKQKIIGNTPCYRELLTVSSTLFLMVFMSLCLEVSKIYIAMRVSC
ncbi:hypothetical protein MMC14_001969 [Varicellaria rhodocarpa]|nr:hypothetical protein [Varicellaria rhodocarpa]